MIDDRFRSEDAQTTGSGCVQILKIDKENELEEARIEPLLYETGTGSSIELLQEMSSDLMIKFEQVVKMSGFENTLLAALTRKNLTTFLNIIHEKSAGYMSISDTTYVSILGFEDIVIFGMSESTAKRLWDNDEDEIWNDL